MGFTLNADKLLDSVLGLDKTGIGLIRSIEWSKKYLWSMTFLALDSTVRGLQTPGAPFDVFFPAIDVDEQFMALQSFQSDAYLTNFQVPEKGEASSLKVTFIDDQKNTLYNFFAKWIQVDILNNGQYVSPLEECVKAIEIRKIKHASLGELISGIASLAGLSDFEDAKISESNKYWVYPTGALVWNGASTSDVNIYSIDFVVGGIVNQKSADLNASDSIANIARSLGATAILGGFGKILGR